MPKQTDPLTAEQVSELLNLLPYVKWDRWAGELQDGRIVVYGWIARDDDRHDFVVLLITEDGINSITSSTKYSGDILARLGKGQSGDHKPCKRVRDTFNL